MALGSVSGGSGFVGASALGCVTDVAISFAVYMQPEDQQRNLENGFNYMDSLDSLGDMRKKLL